MRAIRLAGLVLLAMAGAACSDAGGPNDNACDGPINLTVDATTTPSISWIPVCTVAQVRVIRLSDSDIRWEVGTSGNSISPTVNYGTVPVGGTESVAAQTLTLEPHRVTLLVRDAASGNLFVHASQSFTPQ